MCFAAAFRGMTGAPVPAGRGLLPLADVPDRERSDGGPELVIRRKDAVIRMPVLPRRRRRRVAAACETTGSRGGGPAR